GMSMRGIDLVSHPGQERSFPDDDVLIAGMIVRREPVTVRHGDLERALSRGGRISAYDGEARARRKQCRHLPFQRRSAGRGPRHGPAGAAEARGTPQKARTTQRPSFALHPSKSPVAPRTRFPFFLSSSSGDGGPPPPPASISAVPRSKPRCPRRSTSSPITS